MQAVAMHVAIEDERIRDEEERRVREEVECEWVAAEPTPRWRGRRPTDVVPVILADAPVDPRRCVGAAGHPCPAQVGREDPATVVEWQPAPRIVAEPDVVVVLVGPASFADV